MPKKRKLSWRVKRALRAFPSEGSHSIEDLVKLYNQSHGLPWLVRISGVAKYLKLPMTEERMSRILSCLLVRGLVSEQTIFEQTCYRLTGAGESAK